MNANQIFSVEGQAIFPFQNDQLWQCMAILNSSPFQLATNAICGQHKLHGYVNAVHFATSEVPNCGDIAETIYFSLREIDRCNELSLMFHLPLALNNIREKSLIDIIEEGIKHQTNTLVSCKSAHKDINTKIIKALNAPIEHAEIGISVNYMRSLFGHDGQKFDEIHSLFSWFLGIIVARWDIRYATGEKEPPELPDPFDPLPVCPPGMLQNAEGFPAEPQDVPENYPLRISWGGILVDNEGHPEDIVTRVREVIEVIWHEKASDIEQEACDILGVKTLREYFTKPAKFFADHLKRYSKSRRQAPIYWPLSTTSGSYTLWLYYHRLTDQTLYTCVNDFVEPKLKHVSEAAADLRRKTSRSAKEEKDLERFTDLEAELTEFRDELLRIAAFWKPNLNDGVQITAAPLWKLFLHKPWQKKLKDTWKKLEKGDYDWAHLAYSIWPERVILASHKDRSYAIAHDLEDDLWEEMEIINKRGKTKTVWRPKPLSEEELQQVIQEKTSG